MEKSLYLNIRKELDFEISYPIIYKNLLIDFLLFTILLLSIFFNIFLLIPIIIPILCFRCFSIMHECVHETQFKKRWPNDLLGTLYGGICFLPFKPWQDIHIEHHHGAGCLEIDPTMKAPKDYLSYPKLYCLTFEFCWKYWIPMAGFLQHFVFWVGCIAKVRQHKFNFLYVLNVFAPAIIWFCLFMFAKWQSIIGLLAGVLLYMALVETINLPHHVGKYSNKKIPIWEQYAVSRTCRYWLFFERIFILNFNFHSEHHIFPDLPWYRLLNAHKNLIKNNIRIEIDYQSTWLKEARSAGFRNYLPSKKFLSSKDAS